MSFYPVEEEKEKKKKKTLEIACYIIFWTKLYNQKHNNPSLQKEYEGPWLSLTQVPLNF